MGSSSTRIASELDALIGEIERSQVLVRDPDRCTRSAPSISHWSVRDHLEHLVRSDNYMLDWVHDVATGKAVSESGRPTLTGRIILFFGSFPRGRGKAPERSRPQGLEWEAVVSGLDRALERAKGLHGVVDPLARAGARRTHPVFGQLDAGGWVRLAHIHHRHHRRIIDDIFAQEA